MTFQNQLRLSMVEAPAQLQQACELANLATREIKPDELATCILTSWALCQYLLDHGHNAALVRVELAIWPAERENGGYLAGSSGDGTRIPAARPGWWHGHLAVMVESGHLLDPTIDQANRNLRNVAPMPLVVPLPSWWDSGRAAFYVDDDETMVRYSKFHRQNGWKSAPDSRPSHWRPVLEIMHERPAS
jgi:hypothetical protein